jgi:hypothetical protein
MDKRLKILKENWKLLNEFMKVHEYRAGSDVGSGFYTFFIEDIEYVASVDEFNFKGYSGLDVSFGIVRRDESKPWIDYQVTINDVDATDVVATVVDITCGVAEEEMADKELWLLSFNPTKERDDQTGVSTKRSKLYERIVKRLSSKYGWEMVDVMRMDKDSVAFVMKSSD